MIELDMKDINKLLVGCAFMATGGGGRLERGKEIVSKSVRQHKRKLKMISLNELRDDELTCSVFGVGSIAPTTKEKRGKYWGIENIIATKKLERLLNQKISAIVPLELGAGSTGRAIATAISLDIPIVDGDYAGRAIPELIQCSPIIYGGNICPVIACDEYKDIITINEVADPLNVEIIARWISVAVVNTLKFQTLGCSGFPNYGEDVKKFVVPNTISLCIKIGDLIHKSQISKRDPIDVIIGNIDGYLLFKGNVVNKKWDDRGGFIYGEHLISGIEEFSGHTFKVWFKNENHITWLDDEPYITSPDLITIIDLSSGMPLTNEEISVGDEVAVIGLKAPWIYRTEKGSSVLNPRHFNFNIDYIPIEDQLGSEK